MMTKTITKKIFEFAYGSGLEDAIRQKAFSGYKKPLRDCEEAKETVKNYIDCILYGQKPNFYEVAKMVEKQFAAYIEDYNCHPEDGKKITGKFRFGNAQKLINMTAKYMFILTYDRPDLREKFTQCHCPMDSIMVGHVIDEVRRYQKANKSLSDDVEEIISQPKWVGNLRNSWSQMEFANLQQYVNFQTLVLFFAKEKNLSPIEYDYHEWKSIEKEKE